MFKVFRKWVSCFFLLFILTAAVNCSQYSNLEEGAEAESVFKPAATPELLPKVGFAARFVLHSPTTPALEILEDNQVVATLIHPVVNNIFDMPYRMRHIESRIVNFIFLNRSRKVVYKISFNLNNRKVYLAWGVRIRNPISDQQLVDSKIVFKHGVRYLNIGHNSIAGIEGTNQAYHFHFRNGKASTVCGVNGVLDDSGVCRVRVPSFNIANGVLHMAWIPEKQTYTQRRVRSCDPGYQADEVIPHCVQNRCPRGQHLKSGKCVSDRIQCAKGAGYKMWDQKKAYGSCRCNKSSDYYIPSLDTCLPFYRECSENNGLQKLDKHSFTYGKCEENVAY